MLNLGMGQQKKTYEHEEDIPAYVSEPEMLYAVRKNSVTTEYLSRLKDISGLKDERLSTSLNLSIKTFRNYKVKLSTMKPHLQEHVLALISLYKHGISVFGNQKQFNEWLTKPNHFFDNDQPINFFTTISGIRYVDDRLTAIEYGDNV